MVRIRVRVRVRVGYERSEWVGWGGFTGITIRIFMYVIYAKNSGHVQLVSEPRILLG